jgi:hypothetical protein
MSTGTTKSPNLPEAPKEYDLEYQQQLNNVLRLYFAQLDNPGPSVVSTERNNGGVVAALSFSQRNSVSGAQVLSIPTEAEISLLRVGDVYCDTTAGNVLKVKT